MNLTNLFISFQTMDLGTYIQDELNMTEGTNKGLEIEIGDKLTIYLTNPVLTSWIVMAVLTVLAILLTRNLKVEGPISKRQALMEMAYTKSVKFFEDTLGPNATQYTEYLMSVALFIGLSNMIGMFGLKSPTRNMLVTAVFAIVSIGLIEYTEFKSHGFAGRFKALTEPIWIITPINILEIFTKPLSLCMRLFGNVLGAFTIMEMINYVSKRMVLPMVFSLYFDLFDGLLQAYIFVFLTAIYINQAATVEEKQPKEKAKKRMSKKHKEMLEDHAA